MGVRFNSPRWRSDVYRNGILLVLLLSRHSLRQVQVKSRLEYIVGRVRGETFLLHIRRLQGMGWIVRRQIDVIPKRLPKSRKLQRYQDTYPLASKLMAEWNDRGRNHINGRYEVFLTMNPRLPIGFMGRLKSEVSDFFGFAAWNDGLYCENRDLEATLLNIRNSFLWVCRDITGEPSPRAEYRTETQRSSETWGDEAAVGDDESNRLLKLESPFLPPQCLRRKRNRVWLPEQSTAGRSVMKEGQGSGSFQGGSARGRGLSLGNADRTF